MTNIVILSGAGRYADPWHRFVASSNGLASVARQAGLTTHIRPTDSPGVLDDLGGIDLLVVNTGTGVDPDQPLPPAPQWRHLHDQLATWLDAGRPMLVCHTGAASFRDWPGWTERIGGAWVNGISMHPPMSFATFQAAQTAHAHPFFAGLPCGVGLQGQRFDHTPIVSVYDEAYSKMVLRPQAVPVLAHLGGPDEHEEVMGWTLGDNVVYDGLGHDERSFHSVTRRRYLSNEIDWLLEVRR